MAATYDGAPGLRRKEKVTVIFRDTAIIFKNIKGEERKYNRAGERNFSIMVGEDVANQLKEQGWNVKPLRRQEEDDEQLYHLKVKVSYANQPPQIWLVSNIDPDTGLGRNRTMLGENLVGMLDDLDYTRIDLVIQAYDWNVSGNTGRTAYLRSMYFTMYEDELAMEYSNVAQLPAAGDGSAPAAIEAEQRPPQADYVQDFDPDDEVR